MGIKQLVSAGVPFPNAVKALLGRGGVRGFAARHSLAESAVSGVINGSTRYPYTNVRDALAREFGVERAWIDEQLEQLRGPLAEEQEEEEPGEPSWRGRIPSGRRVRRAALG